MLVTSLIRMNQKQTLTNSTDSLPVLKYGNPILRKKVRPVDDFSILPGILEEMFNTIAVEHGIGLAANQVGFDLNLMIVDTNNYEDELLQNIYIFVNSKIIENQGECIMEEGCLSIPDIRAEIKRPETILLKYQDVEQKVSLATQLNYIDIPIGVKYATDEGFELSGGFIVSVLASDNVEGEIDYDGPGNDSYYEDYFDDIDDYEDAWDDDPKGFLTGLQLGVGYTFNEKFNISVKVQKTGNFGEINDDNDNQNLTLQLSTGLYF